MARQRILIVEDEGLVAEELQQSLTAAGYDVVGIAHSGEEAIAAAERSRPDLVLMDIMLPGAIDGIAAAQHLKSLHIPVIYLTAYSDKNLLDRAQHTEPLGFVLKPAGASELAAVIQLAPFKRQGEQSRNESGHKFLAGSRQADERFHRMVASVTDYAIFTLDLSGMVNSWNRGAERINGYSAQEILGQSFSFLFTAEDRTANIPQNELDIAQMSGSADDSRWLVRRNGERYWAEGALTAIQDDAGLVIGYAKIVRDSTERKQMQDALLQSETRLRVALHAARMGTWQWNLRTGADTLDANLCKLFGLAPEQAPKTIGEFYAIVHPEDRAKVTASFENTREKGVHLDTEFRVVRPDGIERWFLDQGETLLDDKGQPEYLAGACVDITERKQAERSLRESEEQFRLFVNNVQDYALVQTDENGRIMSWNSGAERLLGYPPEEIIGQSYARIFIPEDRANGLPEKELREARTSGRAFDDRWYLRKDGSRFWCSGVMTAVYNGTDRLYGFAKVMRDETERRRAEEAMRASLQEKEVLLKEIHHRVKNNLQVITSLLALQSDAFDNEAARQVFDQTSNRVRSIGDIHELLYLSSNLSHIDFGTYLERLAGHLLAFYGIDPERVKINISTNVELTLSEAIPCGLIVNELLTNSFKHGFPQDKCGQIDVSLRCDAGQCALEVADNGVGLREDFELLGMTSLGLRLVSVLGRQLRGDLQVHRDGRTRFTILFPQGDGNKRVS